MLAQEFRFGTAGHVGNRTEDFDLSFGHHLPHVVVRSPDVHDAVYNIRYQFQGRREGVLGIACNEQWVDMVGPVEFYKGCHLAVDPFGTRGIRRADNDQAFGRTQGLVNGGGQNTADRKLLGIAERALNLLKSPVAKCFGQAVTLNQIECSLRNVCIQGFMTIAEKSIIPEVHLPPPFPHIYPNILYLKSCIYTSVNIVYFKRNCEMLCTFLPAPALTRHVNLRFGQKKSAARRQRFFEMRDPIVKGGKQKLYLT